MTDKLGEPPSDFYPDIVPPAYNEDADPAQNPENDESIEAGNIINEILLAHKDRWDGDDEIQDMVAEAFVRGIKYWQEKTGVV